MKLAFKIFDKSSDGKITIESVTNIKFKDTDWLLMDDCQAIIRALNLKSNGKEIKKSSKNMPFDPKKIMMDQVKHHYMQMQRFDSSTRASPLLSPLNTDGKTKLEEVESPLLNKKKSNVVPNEPKNIKIDPTKLIFNALNSRMNGNQTKKKSSFKNTKDLDASFH
jgi:predicted double-glycine peptidase